MIPEWVRALIRAVRPLIPKDFVGQVEVNCFKGGISNVNVRESHKDDEEKTT